MGLDATPEQNPLELRNLARRKHRRQAPGRGLFAGAGTDPAAGGAAVCCLLGRNLSVHVAQNEHSQHGKQAESRGDQHDDWTLRAGTASGPRGSRADSPGFGGAFSPEAAPVAGAGAACCRVPGPESGCGRAKSVFGGAESAGYRGAESAFGDAAAGRKPHTRHGLPASRSKPHFGQALLKCRMSSLGMSRSWYCIDRMIRRVEPREYRVWPCP